MKLLVPTLGQAVMSLALDDLVMSDANPRQGYLHHNVESMAVSLAREGLKMPILVAKHGKHWMVVEGETRVRAARTLGWKHILAIQTHAPSRADRYIAGRTANTNRYSLTQFDDGVAWGMLIKDGEFESYADLVRKIGLDLPRSELSRMKAFADLPDECIEAMRPHKDKFTSSFALAVRQVQEAVGVRRALNFIKEVVEKDLSFRQAETRRRQICGEKSENTRSRSKVLPITVGDREVGKVNVRGNGRIEITVNEADEAEIQRLGGLVARLMADTMQNHEG